jgi:4-hydroxy-2-oxoheptanedioate aldolase
MGVPWDEYLPHANREICVVAQVESPEAMENVERIAAVPGVDVVFAGPMDLSAAMGVIGQPRHPEVKRFLERMPARVASEGKVAGIALGSIDAGIEAYQQGYRFISIGSLLFSGVHGLTADLAKLRAMFP